MIDLKGTNALVTGAGRGIGKAIALRLADAGANIMLNVRRINDDVETTLAQIRAKGVCVEVIVGDVSIEDDIQAIVKQSLTKFERIDILVNNAGITRDGLLLRMKTADWEDVLNTNLKSAFMLTKAVGKHMLKQRSGRIVNIASVVGVMGNAGQANYAASKAGLIGFTKSVAKEFASRGVTVNAIAPGFIASQMTELLSDEVKANYFANIPMGVFGSGQDVANSVVFLCSNLASYITGQVLHVDGGLVM